MSREDVIREIVAREANREILSEEVVLQEHPTLHGQACEFFGTWKTALLYSGVAGQRKRRKSKNSNRTDSSRNESLDPQSVIKAIQHICWSDYSLSARVIEARNRKLHAAALKHFGSWRAAVAAAGVNLEHAVTDARSLTYTRESLIRELQARYETGQTLVGVRVSLENRNLTRAVKKVFGNWTDGLVAAGINRTKINSNSIWNRELVLKAINDISKQGQSLRCTDVRRNHAGLVTAARKFFPKWDAAVAAAGCNNREKSESQKNPGDLGQVGHPGHVSPRLGQ